MSKGVLAVLISSAGRRVALMRAVREDIISLGYTPKIIVTELSRDAPAWHEADHGEIVPRCTTDAFIDAVLQIVVTHSVRLVIPTIDTELAIYAENIERFAAVGCAVNIGSTQTIAISADKQFSYAWLAENGLPAPMTVPIAQARDANWAFPFVVKPAGGSSAIGVQVVRTTRALQLAIEDEQFGVMVAQKLATGVEYTVSVYVDRAGVVQSVVPRRRLAVRSGEVSKGVTVNNEAVIALATRVAEALPSVWGALNVQIFHDASSGALAIIEVNPRFGGGFPLAWQAGARAPRWLLQEVLGLKCEASHAFEEGLVMLRFDDALFVPASAADLS
jgi:carbamoyl-phosphate synthase large subunit